MKLLCAVCFMVGNEKTRSSINDAITVTGGYAVCQDHQGYAQDGVLIQMCKLVRHEREKRAKHER